jgi:hypothetical protein
MYKKIKASVYERKKKNHINISFSALACIFLYICRKTLALEENIFCQKSEVFMFFNNVQVPFFQVRRFFEGKAVPKQFFDAIVAAGNEPPAPMRFVYSPVSGFSWLPAFVPPGQQPLF